MKILFIAPANSNHTKKWVNAFRVNNKVFLCSMHIDISVGKENVFYLPIKNKLGYYLNALFLKWIVRKIKPDIIHVHYASGYGTLARMAGLKNYILNVWGSDVYDFPYESKLKMGIIKRNLGNAFQIASTSEVMKKQVLKLVNPLREIVVTPFGVDTQIFVSLEKAVAGNFTIGTVKTLSPKYGIATLIRAFDYAVKLGVNDAQLVIVGGGEQERELKEFAASLGSGDKIRFIGVVNHTEVPGWLTRFDVYAALSESESFGVAVVEAESCGIPVIVSSAGGLPEVVKENISGFIVPVGDWETAGEKIFCLYNDEELRRGMGKAGRELVLEKYDWNKSVEIMNRLYQQVYETIKQCAS
ncbi:glycosyl transferase [Spirochaetia bacterium]|nr:glycosyl transferase [Spirochaetia bacterium]